MINSLLILLLIFIALHYYWFLFRILTGLNKIGKMAAGKIPGEFISVIIPFRNESENILKSLRSVTKLDYPKDKLEVIYVNDNSTDDSFEKLNSAAKQNNIKIISADNNGKERAHKKNAVTTGIENSIGDIIVTTDADCIHPEGWLKNLLSMFDKQTALVSGPVEFFNSEKLFAKIQKLEFQGLVLAGAGLIGNNTPVICSAANLAYRKNVFFEVNGFDDPFNLSSGDDELLMQKIRRTGKYEIKFCANRNALVKTESNKSLDQFLNQRKRWASKGLFYADKMLILKLILIFFFYLALPVLAITSFISVIYLFLFIILFSGKCLFEYLIMEKGDRMIFKSGLLKYFFLAEIFQVPYIIYAAISGVFGNYKWKEREVKR